MRHFQGVLFLAAGLGLAQSGDWKSMIRPDRPRRFSIAAALMLAGLCRAQDLTVRLDGQVRADLDQ